MNRSVARAEPSAHDRELLAALRPAAMVSDLRRRPGRHQQHQHRRHPSRLRRPAPDRPRTMAARGPLADLVNLIGPRSVYNEAKRYAEAVPTAYRASQGVDAVIVRIFNTYGPQMCPDDGRVVPEFLCHALAGLPLRVTGDGTQTRSPCYVTDSVATSVLEHVDRPADDPSGGSPR
ncbi:NAD-dependent epimerase/dehydratase family protein [Streptomyces roseirectus]|uniref:NAD-dependent epimerase/dehydratase family protein n=1 Tax=Streptomyces roseirectus TaxID=2768066 RepID=A0A7H0IQ72_9ACTN|nr:NAD-dependent epimerase/dehydratase family protein [Streptomyces roseirectus]